MKHNLIHLCLKVLCFICLLSANIEEPDKKKWARFSTYQLSICIFRNNVRTKKQNR